MIRKHLLWGLAGGITLCVVTIAILMAYPGPTRVEGNLSDGSHVEFEASRRWVILNGGCTTVSWSVDGIKEVYLDNGGRVGHGSEEICVDDEQARTTTLEVHFTDESVREYALEIGLMIYAPEMWVLGVLVMLFSVMLLALVISSSVAHAAILRRTGPLLKVAGRWVALIIMSIVTTALLFEFGLRWYFDTHGSKADRIKYVYSDEDLRNTMHANSLPYVEYGLEPSLANELGYRGEAVAIPKPEGTYRIVVLGDSTVYGSMVPVDKTFPAQLQQQLRNHYGLENVEVVNAGVSGYNTWNSTVALAFRVIELEPDLIIPIHTLTDIGVRAAVTPDCYRGYTFSRGLYPLVTEFRPREQVPTNSVLLRFLGINLGLMEIPDPEKNYVMAFDCTYTPGLEPEDAMMLNPPVYFERNMRSMVAIAQANDIDVLLMTWGYGEDITSEMGPDWWKAAVDEHNAIIRALAEEEDTYFFDLAETPLRHDQAVWGGDYVHKTTYGYGEQARLVAEALTTLLDSPLAIQPD